MDPYETLEFPPPPEGRPYVFINMVATIDGKTVSGDREDDVTGLGSAADRRVMRRIERAADGVLVGARTLRATSHRWNPGARKRIVVSRSGDVPPHAEFFTHGDAYVAVPAGHAGLAEGPFTVWECGDQVVDLGALLPRLHAELGIERLVVMGGSRLNGQLLAADLADELFLTIAPKVKLGTGLPTYAEGEPFARNELPAFRLVEHSAIGDEVFLRYRRNHR